MKRVMRYSSGHCDSWIASEGKKTERMMQTIERHEKKAEELKYFKKTPEYKLQRTVAKIKQWESKKKRAESYLKKLYRRKRLYEKTLNLGV
jgi:valyl-tRNA synthetase